MPLFSVSVSVGSTKSSRQILGLAGSHLVLKAVEKTRCQLSKKFNQAKSFCYDQTSFFISDCFPILFLKLSYCGPGVQLDGRLPRNVGWL